MIDKSKSKKTRVSVPLSEYIYDRVSEDAENIGVSMATFIAVVLGNYYEEKTIKMYMDKSYTIDEIKRMITTNYLDLKEEDRTTMLNIFNNYRK